MMPRTYADLNEPKNPELSEEERVIWRQLQGEHLSVKGNASGKKDPYPCEATRVTKKIREQMIP